MWGVKGVGKITKLGPFYKLITKMGLFHFYLPRESLILLQSAYLRGAFHQNATCGVTWQDDVIGVEVVACQARPLVVAYQALPVVVGPQARPLVVACQARPLVVGPAMSLFPIKPPPLHFIFTQKRWSELSWNVLKRFIHDLD